MSRITEKISSLHLTVWTLVFLILWIGLGLYMAGAESYTKDFRMMNNMLIRDWLFSDKTGAGFLKTWFVILCAAMALMGINLVFCSWSKIFRIMKAKFSGSQFLMFIVHAIFGFVVLGHLGGLMLGFEYNNIKLGEGLKFSTKEGYEIEVMKINFVGDINALGKNKRDISRDEIDYTRSYVEVSLRRNGELLKKQSLYLLRPMNFKDIHVTLVRYILPDDFKESPVSGNTIRAVFAISRNPVLKIFLTLYPVMIAGIFIYLIMTWRNSRFGHNNTHN